MTEQRQPPSIEKVKERSVKIQEICKRADANILILDYIIAQLEEGIRQQPLNRYRLELRSPGTKDLSLIIEDILKQFYFTRIDWYSVRLDRNRKHLGVLKLATM